MFNRTLQKQIEHHFGENLPENLTGFLRDISKTYDRFEKVKNKLEQSVDDSSEAVNDLNEKLEQESSNIIEMNQLLVEAQSIAKLGSWNWDMRTNIVSWSDEVYRTFDVLPSAFAPTYEAFISFIHADDRERIQSIIGKTYTDGTPFFYETRIISHLGNEKYVIAEGRLVTGENGEKIKLVGIIQDITERKAIENEALALNHKLQKSIRETADYRKALDQSLIVYIVAEDGKITYANENFCNITSYSSDELIGQDQSIINSGDHPKEFSENIWSVIKSGNIWRGEIKNKGKYGMHYWVDNCIVPFLNEDGVPYQYLCIGINVTERKTQEFILKESEERYRNIIAASHELIQSIGLNGEFLFVNEQWKKVMGYTSEDLLTMNVFQIIDDGCKEECMTKFSKLMSGQPVRNIQAVFITKDGRRINVEGNAVPRVVDGQLIGAQSFFRDITERLEHEEAMKNKNDEIIKTNQELDKFVYSVSHDLRAPLTCMLGLIEICHDDTSDDIMHQHLNMLEGNIRKLDGFILDILDYSRNSRCSVKTEKIDFNELLHDITDNLKFMGGHNRMVDIKINLNDKHPLHSDKVRLSIVLNNLISNAIRYQNSQIENPFVGIEIDTSDTETGIIIRDNGIGISRENQDKIFEMFYRVSDKSVGSGLGLYIVKETIEKLEGDICVESELGKGTIFNIRIPNCQLQ